MIVKFYNKLKSTFRSLFHSKYNVLKMEDEPSSVDPKTVYIIGEDDFFAFAIMLCPCGCKNKVYLNLLLGNKPTWTISAKNGSPTITPSIWRTSGCKSHYFVQMGKIVWANNS